MKISPPPKREMTDEQREAARVRLKSWATARETIEEMEAPYKAIFGGAPCSQEWCDEIGADGYSETANEIIGLVDQLTGN